MGRRRAVLGLMPAVGAAGTYPAAARLAAMLPEEAVRSDNTELGGGRPD